VEAREPIHTVAIEEGDCRVAEVRRAIDERLRKRGALEKTEGGRGVELDIRHDDRSRLKFQGST